VSFESDKALGIGVDEEGWARRDSSQLFAIESQPEEIM
jgi:hypothetical protein